MILRARAIKALSAASGRSGWNPGSIRYSDTDVLPHVGSKLTGAIEVAQALRGGKASLKHFLANEQNLSSADLPYDPRVLAVIAEARSESRKVYLATASHQRQAEAAAITSACLTACLPPIETTTFRGE